MFQCGSTNASIWSAIVVSVCPWMQNMNVDGVSNHVLTPLTVRASAHCRNTAPVAGWTVQLRAPIHRSQGLVHIYLCWFIFYYYKQYSILTLAVPNDPSCSYIKEHDSTKCQMTCSGKVVITVISFWLSDAKLPVSNVLIKQRKAMHSCHFILYL